MAIPIDRLTSAQITLENKALQNKKREILERQALLSAELHRRFKAAAADRKVGLYTEAEIDEMDSALKRARARRAQHAP